MIHAWTHADRANAIGLFMSKPPVATRLARLHLSWREEIRLQDKANYYADVLIGAAIGIFSALFFKISTAYFAHIAHEHKHALAVVLRCIAWNVSAGCISVHGFALGAVVMRVARLGALGRFLRAVTLTLLASAAFGLIGVVPFAFL